MIMSTMVSAARVFTCGGGGRSDKVLHGHVLSVAVTGAIGCLQYVFSMKNRCSLYDAQRYLYVSRAAEEYQELDFISFTFVPSLSVREANLS